MTDQTTSPSDPLYTVTIFFLDGKKTVVLCDGFEQPEGGQWLQLVTGQTSVFFNVELIAKWTSRDYDSSDEETPAPPPNETLRDTPAPKLPLAGPEPRRLAGERLILGELDRMVHGVGAAAAPAMIDLAAAWKADRASITALEIQRDNYNAALHTVTRSLEGSAGKITDLREKINVLEAANKKLEAEGWFEDILSLREEITDLERARDSADTERECFAVRKANEAEEQRQTNTALRQKISLHEDKANGDMVKAMNKITLLESLLAAMTEDRDLWQEQHNGDCPNLDEINALRGKLRQLDPTNPLADKILPQGDTGAYPGEQTEHEFDHG